MKDTDFEHINVLVQKYMYPKVPVTTSPQFATRALHYGFDICPLTGATIPPLHIAATFAQKSPTEWYDRYNYGRSESPTRHFIEENLANLEGAKFGCLTSSGLAAMSTVLQNLKVGDHIVAFDDTYGGTQSYLREMATGRQGIDVSYVEMSDTQNVIDAIKPNTKLVYLETPTNPGLKLADLEALGKICKKRGIWLCVDNTFASPLLQNPLAFGADFVIHSCTKYIGGHGDVIQGFVATNDEKLHKMIKFNLMTVGQTPSTFDSYLVYRGMKTLELRMKKHCENAMTIARYLEDNPKVKEVRYPGLKSHPQHELAKKQMRGFGGMITFYINGDYADTEKFLSSLRVMKLAVSLGMTDSLIQAPAFMTHANLTKEVREGLGIFDNMVRLSCGIENVEDLIADLERAFKAM